MRCFLKFRNSTLFVRPISSLIWNKLHFLVIYSSQIKVVHDVSILLLHVYANRSRCPKFMKLNISWDDVSISPTNENSRGNASQTEVDQYGKYTTSWRYIYVIHSKASKHWQKNIKTSRERNLYKFTTWRINCIFGFKWIMWIQNGQ